MKKAQLNIITALFMLVAYVLFYAFFFGDYLGSVSASMIADNNLTGIEAFIISYLRLWANIGVLIAFAIIARYGP